MAEQHLIDDPRLTAMGLLVEVYEGITARIDQVHARRGISGTDFDTLIRLARSRGRLRLSDLAAQAALSTSGVTRVVDRLEQRGFVRREVAPGDRRGFVAVLTDAGVERVAADLPELLAAIDRWFTGVLGAERLAEFLAGLRELRQVVRPQAVAGGGPDDRYRAGRPPTTEEPP